MTPDPFLQTPEIRCLSGTSNAWGSWNLFCYGVERMKGLLQDVKFGFRMMARNPWFTFVCALTLALGIAVNSVGFSIANGAWWKRLPFQNPKELTAVVMSDGSLIPAESMISYREFKDIQDTTRSFKEMVALEPDYVVLGSEGSLAERIPGARVTPNLFTFLGIRLIRGRDFTSDDARPGAPLVALISHSIWQGRFGGREDIIGSVVRIDGVPATIIGVAPPGFRFPYLEKVWTPLLDQNMPRNLRTLIVFGRLAPGKQLEEARSEVRGLGQNLERNFPETNKGFRAIVLPFLGWMNGPEPDTAILLVFGAAVSVLLVACVNVASLLLSRSVQRSREVAVRTAIGASRWRIIRQVLIESVMLSLSAGVFGLFLAGSAIRWFSRALGAADMAMPYWINFEMDYAVSSYFFLSCIATGIAFGIVPAFQISRTNVNQHLKEGARQATGGFRARRMTSLLLIAEIAITTTLLAEAGLLMKGFLQFTRTEMGFDTRHLIVANVELPWDKYRSNPERIAFVEAITERLNRPGRSATVAFAAPLSGALSQPLKLEGRDIVSQTGVLPNVSTLPVHTGYFDTLNVKLRQGRDFVHGDGSAGSEVAIVNERFAARYWPGENPIGKRLRVGSETAPWLHVVGVSPDVFQVGSFLSGPRPLVYLPFRQRPFQSFSILAHSTESSSATATEMRTEAARLDPDLALSDVRTLDDQIRMEAWPTQVFTAIFAICSVMALLMSSIGLYGVTAHGVSQRTQEIGVRTALGATPGAVIWLVLKQYVLRVAAGLTLGLLGAALLGDFVKGVLSPEVPPRDPLTFVSISLLMASVALMACVIPAWRAARFTPANALRME